MTYRKSLSEFFGLPTTTPPPYRLGQVSGDAMVAVDGPSRGATVEFVRRADGSVGWVRIGGRIYARQI